MVTGIAELPSSTTFNWRIENFSKLNPNKDGITSDVFSVGSFKWKAEIYPKGDSRVPDNDHLSLFLCPVDLTQSVYAEFSFAVTNSESDQTYPKHTVRWEFTKEFIGNKCLGWGWSKLMRLSEIHDPDKGFIVNDTCVITVEVTCSTTNKVSKEIETKETDDKSCSVSGEYPGAGKPFVEGRHDYKVGFGEDKEFEDIGGFSILKTQAPVYKQIWLRYGHIPSTKVMPISLYPILVMLVKDLMKCILDMHQCHYVDLSSEMIEHWEGMITMAEKNEFSIAWLRERFETVKKGMGGMQNVKTQLLELRQPLRDAKEKLKVLKNAMKKFEVQLAEAEANVRKNTCGLLSGSDVEKYIEIGEDLLLDGLF